MKRGLLIALFALVVGVTFVAPVKVQSSVRPGDVEFSYIVTEEDWDYVPRNDDMTMQLWIRKARGDWDYYDMYFDEEAGDDGEFYVTVDLARGDYEFYFAVNDTGLDMKDYCGGWYSPEADSYADDGVGGYNAKLTVR